MYEAHQEAVWDHTALVASMIHNVNCTKANQQRSPLHWHPFRKEERVELGPKESVAMLRSFLLN